jgi:hypothetical protein
MCDDIHWSELEPRANPINSKERLLDLHLRLADMAEKQLNRQPSALELEWRSVVREAREHEQTREIER